MFDIKFMLSGSVMMQSRWCCLPRVGEFVELEYCRFVVKSITYKITPMDTVAVVELSWED